MRSKRNHPRRLWVEELESRVVLSPVPFNTVYSDNWSGYSSMTSLTSPQASAVSAVSGSWTVPAVAGKGTAYSSFWVGIDGYSSNSVEQIGTDSDLVNGVPTYYAWYEMYPNPFHKITTIHVAPGDVISASVTADTANNFTLAIANGTQSFSITLSAPTAKRSSAEWIAEAPLGSFGRVLPLANFGTANFSNSSATIDGTTGAIDDSHWQNTAIDMVARNGVVKTTTGGLSDSTVNGAATSSFSVTFKCAGTGSGGGGGKGSSKGDDSDRSDIQFVQTVTEQSNLILANLDSPAPLPAPVVGDLRSAANVPVNAPYPAWMVGGPAGADYLVLDNDSALDMAFRTMPANSPTRAADPYVNLFTDVLAPSNPPSDGQADLLPLGIEFASVTCTDPMVSDAETSTEIGASAVGKVSWLAGLSMTFAHAAMFSTEQSRKTRRKIEELVGR